jgi:hypothetical protein
LVLIFRESDIVKKPQRSSFKFSPVAAAVAVAVSSQFTANVALAGSGFGSGYDRSNLPVAVPTFYANSPAGPAPTYDMVTGKMTINATTQLANPIYTGKALRKFVDPLPTIPAAVAEKWVDLNGVLTNDDYYEIAAVEFTQKMHSDLVKSTRLRAYVQLSTLTNPGSHIQLFYPAVGGAAPVAITDPARITAANPNGYVYAYDNPHHLGPIINATKGVAVRVKFTNLLPKGAGGNLFLPVDPTITGAGVGPDGHTMYTQNRANIHLVGGEAPWISAGTPHQWIAPAGETNPASDALGNAIVGGQLNARGASNKNVPDMADPGPGSSTLYFPNDLSARFTFIQDRTSGLTRLNSYAGLEAGYVVTDAAEQLLITSGAIPGAADTIPLIIEDKTFVPQNVTQQDARWTDANWGQQGDLWFPHVYEPNQDTNSISGANPVGRWDYGPLFWPIFPSMRGLLPVVSATPEAYLDTPVINGTAYPTLTVDPKAYRFRILNASNDRYINLGLYKADGTVQAPQLDENGNAIVDVAGNQQFFTNTEVKMIPASADAVGDPPGWDKNAGVQLPLPQFPTLPWHINAEQSGPTRAWPKDGRDGGAPAPVVLDATGKPVLDASGNPTPLTGPDFVVIGNDGGFLPNPVDIPSQPVTYETNRRSITVLSIYGYGMLLGPAERADTVVDFSAYAGQTLILYNDAPAPTPFIDARNDYYTGNPDLTAQGGAYTTQPGYGPNTRTMMQIKVNAVAPAAAFNADALKTALPAAYASSVPPIVPAVAYNAAFGTNDADVIAHVATGSISQPTLNFTTAGALTLQNLSLITSGGTAGAGGVVVGNAVPGSGSGYRTAPKVVIGAPNAAAGTQATATATVDNVPNAANNFVPTYQVTGLTLDNPGLGYTAAPTVVFVPQPALTSVTMLAIGSGYTNPKVTIDPPPLGGIQATATASIAAVLSISPIVAVADGGTGYTAPVVSFDTHGGPGAGAAGYATVSTSPLSPGISGTSVSDGGSGYTAPTVNFSTNPGNPGTGALGTVQFSQSVSLPASGLNITGFVPGETLVTIAAPASGIQATADPIFDVLTGDITGFTMTGGGLGATYSGSGYKAAPAVTITEVLTGVVTPLPASTASLAVGTGVVTGVTITSVGSGYTQAPILDIVDPAAGIVKAKATVTLQNIAGTVTAVTITNTGSGYTTAPTLVLTDANHPLGVATAPATNAVAPIALTKAAGAIEAIIITDPGTGYTSAPHILIVDQAPGVGKNALAIAGMTTSGVGAQASWVTTNTKSITVGTKAEQELFDDYGRYNSTGGVELPLVNGVIQTTVPLNYIDSSTEIINDKLVNNENLQVWKLVDNGFWSNSVHFDMVDVQLINRVGWDGTVKPPASNEVGWKDTLRLNPLEDVIIAMRAKTATVPFGQPQSKRLLDPSKQLNVTATHPTLPTLPVAGVTYASGLGFTGALAVGVTPAVAAKNEVRTFDHEFTWGSALLGHAENDFRRSVIFNPTVVKPDAPFNLMDPTGTAIGLTWTDPTPSLAAATLGNTKNELGFKIVKAPAPGGVLGVFDLLNPVATLPANAIRWAEMPAALPNVAYAVVAYNVAGDSNVSNAVINAAPAAPVCSPATTAFTAGATTTTDVAVTLNCFDNANNEQTFQVSRDGVLLNGAIPGITLPAPSPLTFVDPTILVEATTYTYGVTATNVFGTSVPVTTVVVTTPVSVPLAPSNLAAVPVLATCPVGIQSPCKPADVKLSWTDAAFNEAGYTVTRTGGVGAAFAPVNLPGTALNNTGTTLSYVDPTAAENVTYTYTVSAFNVSGPSPTQLAYTLPVTAPTIPTGLSVVPSTALDANGTYVDTAALTWTDNAFNETGYTVSRAVTAPPALVAPATVVGTVPAGINTSNNPMGIATAGWAAPNPTMSYTDTNLLADGVTYAYTVVANNAVASTSSTPAVTAVMPGIIIAAPTNFVATPNRNGFSIGLSWRDNATNETDYLVEERKSIDGGVTFDAWAPVTGTPIASAAPPNNRGGTVTVPRGNIPTNLNTLYAFRVSARNVPSDSPYAYVQSNLAAPTAPAAPVLGGSLVQATRQVSLTWNAVTPAAGTTISYIVNVNGTPVPTNNTFYNYRATTAQLMGGIALNYTVQAVARANRVNGQTVFGSSSSIASNIITLNAVAPVTGPATPTGLAATITAATGAVRLNWTAVAPIAGATITYMVSVDGGTPVAMARGATITPALTPGVNHTVSVVARATSLGLFTDSAVPATTTVDLTAAVAPAAPANLRVSATALNWGAPTVVPTNATVTYTVQQSVDNGATWTTLTAVPTAARTWTVASPVGANYLYRVAALATRYGQPASAPSLWTTTPFNTAPAASTAPTVALTAALRNLSFSWTNTSTNITGFTIQRRSPAGVWATIAPAPTVTQVGNVYSIADVVAAAGSYTYRVTATSLGGTTAQATSSAIVTP